MKLHNCRYFTWLGDDHDQYHFLRFEDQPWPLREKISRIKACERLAQWWLLFNDKWWEKWMLSFKNWVSAARPSWYKIGRTRGRWTRMKLEKKYFWKTNFSKFYLWNDIDFMLFDKTTEKDCSVNKPWCQFIKQQS